MHVGRFRIESAQHVLDRTVLAGAVHGLKDEQHRPSILRIQKLGQLEQLPRSPLEEFARALIRLERSGIRRVVARQVDAPAGLDAEPLGVYPRLHRRPCACEKANPTGSVQKMCQQPDG